MNDIKSCDRVALGSQGQFIVSARSITYGTM